VFTPRIKVLTEKGKELATQEVPYLKGNFKITDIKARTITRTDYHPACRQAGRSLVSKSGDQQIERKVFTLPSVEVGSILEFTYTIRYDDNHYSSPMWEIQRDYFVHKAHYQFTPERSFYAGAQVASSIVLTDSKGQGGE